MNETKRPVSILILVCVYLAVGSIGFVYHFSQLRQPDGVWIALTELLAILCGAFMLRGQNWARWLALAWIAFHVILSASSAHSLNSPCILYCSRSLPGFYFAPRPDGIFAVPKHRHEWTELIWI